MTAVLELPTPEASSQAREAVRRFAPVFEVREEVVTVRTKLGTSEQSVVVPRQAFALFVQLLGEIANGNAVTIVPVHAELTTQQAAEYLNVSRPHVVKLIESGVLPHHKVGTHRRIKAADLFRYKAVRDADSRKAVAELTRLSQEMGLYE